MSKEFPHVYLMQTKGLQKSELPDGVKYKISQFTRLKGGYASANRNKEIFELSEAQKNRLEDLDKEICDGIWDYLTEKQNQEMRAENNKKEEQQPISEKKEEQNPSNEIKEEQNPIKEEEKKEEEKPQSKGRIGFFEF